MPQAFRARKALVLLSGGIDSMACVAYYKAREFEVSALHLTYGQAAAKREAIAARRVARAFDVPLAVTAVDGLAIGSGKIPGRNALVLTIGLMAFSAECGILSLGIHAGTPYPDCSDLFVSIGQRLIDLYLDGSVQLDAPFLQWSKRDIFDYARDKALPLELTYSCELGIDQPCGRCASCADIEVLNAR
jgi:7-cyano-7-deazaguanine synthase